jgi:hypothetical protein
MELQKLFTLAQGILIGLKKMKFNKIIYSFLLSIFIIFGVVSLTNADRIIGLPFSLNDTNNWIPSDSAYTIGSPSDPFLAGYFTNLFASSTSFTRAGGDLNMGGYSILNAGSITGTTISATSTTATSTIAAGLQITGSIHSNAVSPASFFTANTSGVSTFRFLDMEEASFNTIAIDLNSSLSGTMQWLDFGGCQSTWQGVSIGAGISFTEQVCDVAIDANGNYRSLKLEAARNITLNAAGTSTPLIIQRNGTESIVLNNNGYLGIGTTTSLTSMLTVATSTNNATSTFTLGKPNQNKGSCLALFDSAGTAVYAYVPAGGSSFTLSAISCK